MPEPIDKNGKLSTMDLVMGGGGVGGVGGIGILPMDSSCSSSFSSEETTFFEDAVWGFRITGGAEFGMPITVFHVTEGGRAYQAGIKLGDSIVKINDHDTKDMPLSEAHQRIQDAGGDIKLSVKNFEDEDVNGEHQVELDNKSTKKDIDRDDECWIPQPERKVWHPIVWQQPPPPIRSNRPGEEAPHKRLINNIYRFFRETENNPGARQKQIEEMLLALPTISK